MKHASVFSGIGGFDLAAERAGLENIWNCDNNSFCRKVLKKNFPNVKQYDDIKTVSHPEPVDVMSGGFPCQDISNAKTWDSDGAFCEDGIAGKRSGLWWQFHRLIEETRPKFVVAENVAAITKKGLNEVIHSLSDIGYDAEWTIISAAKFGAPHLRKRIWIVAYPFGFGRLQESVILCKVFSEKVRHSSEWKLSRTICKETGKKTLPGNFGIHDGLPRRVDDAERITALGNAIVPQIAQSIFEVIKQHYEQETN